jgi:hypothetical protein
MSDGWPCWHNGVNRFTSLGYRTVTSFSPAPVRAWKKKNSRLVHGQRQTPPLPGTAYHSTAPHTASYAAFLLSAPLERTRERGTV